MPSFTDEVMAIADVYAESLLRAANQKGEHDEVAAEFDALIAYMDEHPDFEGFLVSATVDDDARRESLERLFRGRMNDLLLNLVQVINRRGRPSLIRAVHRAVVLRIEEEHHQQEVLIETATPLTDDLRERMKEVLSARIGKEALLIERIRPELIGGVVVHVGDRQLDASLLTAIGLIRRRLAHRTTIEVHRGDGRYLEG